jgi:hypothetical protein
VSRLAWAQPPPLKGRQLKEVIKMALTKQEFTKSWTDSDDFPTFVENEAQVRADMQELHTQMQSYINNVLTQELDTALAGKLARTGLSLSAVNNNNGTLTVSISSGGTVLASALLPIGEAQTITNTYITNELYVNYGYIADLLVNRLRTDWDRAQRYEAGLSTPINYISIQDEQLRFISGVSDGSSSQLSFDGVPYYWTDATRTRLTSNITSHPAYAYDYTELVKLAFEFREITLANGEAAVMPVLILGAGTGSGENGKAMIYKDSSGLRLKYSTEDSGLPVSLELDNSGNIKKRIGQVSGVLQAALSFSNITVYPEGWSADETYETFPFKAVISGPGVTADMGGELIFHPDTLYNNILAPVAVTGEGTVGIFAAQRPLSPVEILRIRAVF